MKKYHLLGALLLLTATHAFATLFPDEQAQREIFANLDTKKTAKINKSYTNEMRKQTAELNITQKEIDDIQSYTVDSNDFVNDYLKDGVTTGDTMSAKNYQTRIKKFSRILNKFPPSDTDIYRGSSGKGSSGGGEPYYNLDETTPSIVEGDFLVTDKFASFSYNFSEASEFSRMGPEGDTGIIFGVENSIESAPIGPYSYEEEAEALVKPGQIYKIKEITSYKDFFDDENQLKKMVTVELEEQEMLPADANTFFMSEGRALTTEELQTFKGRLGASNKSLIPKSLDHNVNGKPSSCTVL